jgi:UrcA family protein
MQRAPSVFRASVTATVLAFCALQVTPISALADSASMDATATSVAESESVTSVRTGADRVQLQLVVPYHDLDLSTGEGLDVMAARIIAAAKQVCGDADIRDLRSMQVVAQCREDATRDAMWQVEGIASFWLLWRADHAIEPVDVARNAEIVVESLVDG